MEKSEGVLHTGSIVEISKLNKTSVVIHIGELHQVEAAHCFSDMGNLKDIAGVKIYGGFANRYGQKQIPSGGDNPFMFRQGLPAPVAILRIAISAETYMLDNVKACDRADSRGLERKIQDTPRKPVERWEMQPWRTKLQLSDLEMS